MFTSDKPTPLEVGTVVELFQAPNFRKVEKPKTEGFISNNNLSLRHEQSWGLWHSGRDLLFGYGALVKKVTKSDVFR